MRIVFADDHDAVRKGVRAILADSFEDLILDEAQNGKEAVDLALANRPIEQRQLSPADDDEECELASAESGLRKLLSARL